MSGKDESEKPTFKTDEPWSDKERLLIVQHVLKSVEHANLFEAIAEHLYKEGFPLRKKNAVSDS